MKLIDLNPSFVDAGGEGITQNGKPVERREGVGIGFDCPCGCDRRCYIDFTNPLDGLPPHRVDGHTWERTGETFETMTLRPSIQRADPDGCKWHGFLTDGVFKSC